MTPQEMQIALAAPFPAESVKFLPKSIQGNRALALPYVDARIVMGRLDDVFGISGWQDKYDFLPNGTCICELMVLVGGSWITRMDVGSPSEQPDIHDKDKAAVSDALKRAAVKFGVGRYLYRLGKIWCGYDPSTKELKAPRLPDWALPKAPSLPKAPVLQPIEMVCEEEYQELDRLIRESGANPVKFVEWASLQLGYQVEDVNFLPTSFFNKARSALLDRQAKQGRRVG